MWSPSVTLLWDTLCMAGYIHMCSQYWRSTDCLGTCIQLVKGALGKEGHRKEVCSVPLGLCHQSTPTGPGIEAWKSGFLTELHCVPLPVTIEFHFTVYWAGSDKDWRREGFRFEYFSLPVFVTFWHWVKKMENSFSHSFHKWSQFQKMCYHGCKWGTNITELEIFA